MNDKQLFGINGHKCDGFILKTFKTEISSGKVGIKNPPYTASNNKYLNTNNLIPRQSAGR